MNTNLNQCQVLEAFKRFLNDSVTIKPFITTQKDDFKNNTKIAYYGVFHGNNGVTVANSIDASNTSYSGSQNVFFTSCDSEDFINFTGYEIHSKISLYNTVTNPENINRTLDISNLTADLIALNFLKIDFDKRIRTIHFGSSSSVLSLGNVIYNDVARTQPLVNHGDLNSLAYTIGTDTMWIIQTNNLGVVTKHELFNF